MLKANPQYLEGDRKKSRNAFTSKAYKSAEKQAQRQGKTNPKEIGQRAYAAAAAVYDAARAA